MVKVFPLDHDGELKRLRKELKMHARLKHPCVAEVRAAFVEGTPPNGYIHFKLYEQDLKDHPAPEDCEYYMCGPPMMNSAVINMLLDLGVERENIFLDDFGG